MESLDGIAGAVVASGRVMTGIFGIFNVMKNGIGSLRGMKKTKIVNNTKRPVYVKIEFYADAVSSQPMECQETKIDKKSCKEFTSPFKRVRVRVFKDKGSGTEDDSKVDNADHKFIITQMSDGDFAIDQKRKRFLFFR